MRIAWFVDLERAVVSADIGIAADSPMAGLRYRVGLPAKVLAGEGVSVTLVSLSPGAVPPALSPSPDVAVFGKPYWRGQAAFDRVAACYTGTAAALRAAGVPVVFDLTDHLFVEPRRGYAEAMVEAAAVVTTSSGILAEIVAEHCGREATVVPDPVEGIRRAPDFHARYAGVIDRVLRRAQAEPLRLLWFGGQLDTFLALSRWFPELVRFARRQPIRLAVLMDPLPAIRAALDGLAGTGVQASLTPWSLAAVTAALAACDLVLLPADTGNPRSYTASANRLITALWAGRLPIAGPIPSYLDMSDAAWVGDNPVHGIEWALAHPGQAQARIEAGQLRIANEFTPAAIAARWRVVFGKVIARDAGA